MRPQNGSHDMKMRFSTIVLFSFGLVPGRAQLAPAQDVADEKAKARTAEHSRRTADEDASRLKRQFMRDLTKAEETKELLDQLSKKTSVWTDTTTALLTNDDGKRLAADPTSLMAVIKIFQAGSLSLDEIS